MCVCVCVCDAHVNTNQSVNIYCVSSCGVHQTVYAKKGDTFPDFKVPMTAPPMIWNQLSSLNFLVLIKSLFKSLQLLFNTIR